MKLSHIQEARYHMSPLIPWIKEHLSKKGPLDEMEYDFPFSQKDVDQISAFFNLQPEVDILTIEEDATDGKNYNWFMPNDGELMPPTKRTELNIYYGTDEYGKYSTEASLFRT